MGVGLGSGVGVGAWVGVGVGSGCWVGVCVVVMVTGGDVGVVGVVLVLAAARLSAVGDRSAGLWVASIGMLLASPVSWSHHWVWMVPLALAVLCSAARKDVPRLARWAAGGMLAAAVLQVIWWVPSRDGRELEWNAWQMVLGNAYVWGGLLLTVALVPLAARQVRELLAGRGGVGSDA